MTYLGLLLTREMVLCQHERAVCRSASARPLNKIGKLYHESCCCLWEGAAAEQGVSQVVLHLLVRAQLDSVLRAFAHARSYSFTLKSQAAVASLQGLER